mmetsp:Transcript_38987/g.99907  ORF Transcript_38987/g.99907 Transcript_38987/m.99907 type:complete len:82 (-) Transcript_38987:212-457(-)
MAEESPCHRHQRDGGQIWIKRLSMDNFLGQKHLDFKLGPHLNFVIDKSGGQNTAILDALQLVLGSNPMNEAATSKILNGEK